MYKFIKSEWLKEKRTFNRKSLWLVPLVCVAISFLLMGPNYVQTAGYNWWYTLFLPFTFSYASVSIINREKKHNFHGIFAIAENKGDIWYSKIIVSTIYLTMTSLFFFFIQMLLGFIFGAQINIGRNLAATLLLILTFAWQIPLYMIITLKWNQFIAIFLSVFGNLFIACLCAPENYWWIPFAIPARIMCPVISVLPNGLLMEAGDSLNNTEVIWIGLLITIVLYIGLSIISSKVFESQEA